MNKPLFLLAGKSASGKTTVQNILTSVSNYVAVESYTTREKRSPSETGHTFITDEEFNMLENIIASCEYDGHKYCATRDMVDATDLYVIDPNGVEELLKRYETDRKIVVLYFKSSVCTRIDRMRNRQSSDSEIVARLYIDESFSWYDKLHKTVWHYQNNESRDVEMLIVDADKDIEQVVKQVFNYINTNTEEE